METHYLPIDWGQRPSYSLSVSRSARVWALTIRHARWGTRGLTRVPIAQARFDSFGKAWDALLEARSGGAPDRLGFRLLAPDSLILSPRQDCLSRILSLKRLPYRIFVSSLPLNCCLRPYSYPSYRLRPGVLAYVTVEALGCSYGVSVQKATLSSSRWELLTLERRQFPSRWWALHVAEMWAHEGNTKGVVRCW